MEQFCPPPLNSSNINDIANALQALNISAENRSTLGISGTQDMQDALLALKQLIQQTQTDLTETKQDISTVCPKFFVSSFVGNGQSTITVPWPEEKPFDTPYLTIISHIKGSSSSDKSSIAIAYGDIFLFFSTEDPFPANSSYAYNGWAQIRYNNNGNLFKVNIGSNNSYSFNLSGRTYNYLVLGT